MKKLIAGAAAALAVAAISACGDDRPDPVFTSAGVSDAPISDWKSVGTEGLSILDSCGEHSDDAVMYSCDHADLMRLESQMQGIPKESRDIRNVISTFQNSYVKYWATHKCGTPEVDTSNFNGCDTLYKKWLEMSLTDLRKGFENLAAGNPV